MDEMTRVENTPNEPGDSKPVDPGSSSLISTKMKSLDLRRNFNQSLDTITASVFSILKLCVLLLALLAIFFILTRLYTQEGTVILPFEVNNVSLSGVAIADQLTAELIRIQQIHAVKYEDLALTSKGGYFLTKFSTEESLGRPLLIVPKAEIVEFNIADVGNIDVGVGSLSLGKLMLAFKNICPGSKPVTTIRGSLQRYGSTIVLVGLLEGKNVQSWTLKQPIDNNNEERLHEMIKDLASRIAHDLQQSEITAKTWEGLKYYTDALDACHRYNQSGNPDFLSLSGNYSLEAIRSEKGYKKPYDLLSWLEFTYIKIGKQNNAIKCCNETIDLDLNSSYAWYNKGRVLDYFGRYSEAIQDYDTAIENDPQYAKAWNYKGVALSNQGKYEEAINAYDEAIKIDPQYAEVWYSKGWTLSNQSKYEEAINAYDEAIKIDPQNAIAWLSKGWTLKNQGKYDEAINAYDEAIKIDPKLVAAWYNKGIALNNQSKYDEAINAYDEAIKIDPQYAKAWNYKGIALNNQGKHDEADAAFTRAKELGYTG